MESVENKWRLSFGAYIQYIAEKSVPASTKMPLTFFRTPDQNFEGCTEQKLSFYVYKMMGIKHEAKPV